MTFDEVLSIGEGIGLLLSDKLETVETSEIEGTDLVEIVFTESLFLFVEIKLEITVIKN